MCLPCDRVVPYCAYQGNIDGEDTRELQKLLLRAPNCGSFWGQIDPMRTRGTRSLVENKAFSRFMIKSSVMAEVIHRNVGRDCDVPERKQSKSKQEREELDAEWRRKRIGAETAKQRLHEAKMLAMRGELISRKHMEKQAAFLVLSLRARLLALSARHARELLNVSDEREMAQRLDAIMRSALDEISELPLRVTDENWMQKLDENESTTTPSKCPRRVAK